MANGTINGSTSNSTIVSKIEWSSTSNISANTSLVTASLYYRRTNTGYTTEGTGNFSITIDGTTTNRNSLHLAISDTWVLAMTASKTVSHDSNGTKTISISATGSLPPSSLTSTSCSGKVKLDTIPRASTFTVDRSEVTAGNSFVVKITKASANFTHRVLYSYNKSTWTTINANDNATVTVTVPTSYCSHYPNSMSGTLWLRLDTYNGSTLLGSSAVKSITLNVPDYTPALTSITAERVDGSVPASWGLYLKGKSKAKITFNGAATSYGASIKSYVALTTTSSSSPVTTDFLPMSGEVKIGAFVVDSRGKISATKNVTITVVDYFNPSILSYDIHRCLQDGTASEDGTYLSVKAHFIYADCNKKNAAICTVTYREAGSSASFPLEQPVPDDAAIVIGGGAISTQKEYEVRLGIYDLVTSATPFYTTRIIPISKVIMSVRGESDGVAFGKVAELSNTLDAQNWDGKFKSVTIGDESIADYIVENGVSGIWRYRKWKSGVAECWCEYHAVISSFQNSGAMYYQTFKLNFPFTFSERPAVSGGTGFTYLDFVNMSPSTDTLTVVYMQFNNATTSGTRNIWIHAIGMI